MREICEISKRQNRALINAFLICLLPSANDVRHPSAQVHGAKVVLFFGLSKKNSILLRFLFRNWWVNYFSNRVNLFRNGINLFRERVNFFRKPILRKVLLGREEVGLVFSRSSVGGIRQGIREVKEITILTKSTFSISAFLGSSLVRLWFVLGL